jgi:hypothetical protein
VALVNQRGREFERVAGGVRGQPPWLLPKERQSLLELESPGERRESSQTPGKPAFHASWLTLNEQLIEPAQNPLRQVVFRMFLRCPKATLCKLNDRNQYELDFLVAKCYH